MHSLADRAERTWLALTPGRRTLVAWTVWALATLPVLTRLVIGRPAGDLTVYMNGVDALLHGPLIYRDVDFEYPPYALLWFLLPRAFSSDLDGFRLAFGLEMWVADAAIKGTLLWQGLRAARGIRAFAPVLAYAIGSAALGHVLLQRFDLVPAALTLFAALAVAGGSAVLGGVLLALGAGTKLYPALLVPVFAVFAARRIPGGFFRFGSGFAAGLLPLLVVGLWMPWWRFASYHVDRGLQAESVWASVVWALHFAGVPAGWEFVTRWNEVTGPLAERLVEPGRLVWGAASLASVGLATWTAWHLRAQALSLMTVGSMAALFLLPIATFVATNTVLSPQFHLWLLPLAALVVSGQPGDQGSAPVPPVHARRAATCIVLASLIVPIFYPHREYATGLGPFRTGVLLLRNGLLLYATVCLWVAVGRMRQTRAR